MLASGANARVFIGIFPARQGQGVGKGIRRPSLLTRLHSAISSNKTLRFFQKLGRGLKPGTINNRIVNLITTKTHLYDRFYDENGMLYCSVIANVARMAEKMGLIMFRLTAKKILQRTRYAAIQS